MIEIRWDDALSPNEVSNDIKRWDEWFAVVGLAKEWSIVKDQFPDDEERQLLWATIIELNRIDAEVREKCQAKSA